MLKLFSVPPTPPGTTTKWARIGTCPTQAATPLFTFRRPPTSQTTIRPPTVNSSMHIIGHCGDSRTCPTLRRALQLGSESSSTSTVSTEASVASMLLSLPKTQISTSFTGTVLSLGSIGRPSICLTEQVTTLRSKLSLKTSMEDRVAVTQKRLPS